MRTIFKTALALTGLALLSAGPASASSSDWRQSCSGPAYVCGDAGASKSSKATVKAAAAKYKSKSYAQSASKPAKVRTAKSSVGGGSSGMASWYGGSFHGRKTASGETYNQNALTAAHRSLPFGTRVQVTNTRTGSSVIVRINDRGPFVGGRVIDLSRAAASQIGVTSSGVAPVRVTVLGRG